MARARNIKPGFFRNADLVELSFEARLLFIGLWTIADREGRLEDRPKQIKMELFPADNMDCDAMLAQLAAINMIERYEHDGKRYIQVVSFAKHQNPHRDEKASTLPDRDGNVATAKAASIKHGASTVQTPCEEQPNTVAIGLNPESCSLIPDSRILTPEATTKEEEKPARAPRKPSTNLEPLDLVAEGVELQHARDWRTARKSPITPTAWDELKTEAKKAGITPGEAVRICAIKGWRGFDSTWKWQQHAKTPPNTADANAEAARILGFSPDEVIDA